MTSSMYIIDIAGSPAAGVAELAQDQDAALVWPHIKMAAVRTLDAIPASVLDGLDGEPREVNRDRWAVVHGLDQLLREHDAHSRAVRLGGNASLTWTAEQLASGLADEFTPPEVRRTRMGWMAAINMSVGIASRGEVDHADPVTVATRRVTEAVPVVMAAGNARQQWRGPAALSAWAKAPWVISVSALRDGTLAPDSAFGDPDDPGTWPTVAAPDDLYTEFDAQTGEVEAHRGTSIAAPVVTRQIAVLTALLLTVRSAALDGTDAREGVPRVGLGLLDFGIDSDQLSTPRWPYGELPPAGLAPEGVTRLVEVARRLRIDLTALPTPASVRALLLASARPVAGLGKHQVGAGEISPGTSATFLARLTVAGLLRALTPGQTNVHRELSRHDGVALTDETIVPAQRIWALSEHWWVWDFREARQILGLTLSSDEEVQLCLRESH